MNDDTLEKLVEKFSALTAGRNTAEQFLRSALQEAYHAGIEACVGVVPAEAPCGHADKKCQCLGYNNCRTETLKALEALKETATKESTR